MGSITVKEVIEILEAYKEGRVIQMKEPYESDDDWYTADLSKGINTMTYDYRIKPEPVAKIIEWRMNSNGVILWGNENDLIVERMVTTVAIITPWDKEKTIYVDGNGWYSVEAFLKRALKADGTKFEIEISPANTEKENEE